MTDEVVHPELARRLAAAVDGNPDVPPHNYGRLNWFQTELEARGVDVGIETIRKWFVGVTRPREKAMEALAKVLKVDHAWLSTGKQPEFGDKEQKRYVVIAAGVVNLVAGFIQLDGGHPAVPAEGDVEAAKKGIHLYAVIRGAKYDLHILPSIREKNVEEGGPKKSYFLVPHEARDTLVLGVVGIGGFAVRIFELDWETVEAVGTRKSGGFQVSLDDAEWTEIKTFANRL